jgi:hypothetical protein
MVIKTIARNLWPAPGSGLPTAPRRSTWYEPLEDQAPIDAAVAFVLARPEVTGICTAGDVDLLPRLIDAERRRTFLRHDEIDATLREVPDYEPPFIRIPGRETPDWLESVLPD